MTAIRASSHRPVAMHHAHRPTAAEARCTAGKILDAAARTAITTQDIASAAFSAAKSVLVDARQHKAAKLLETFAAKVSKDTTSNYGLCQTASAAIKGCKLESK